MVDGIQGNGRVNSDIKINNLGVNNDVKAPALGVFGFGDAKGEKMFCGPIERLTQKFNFDVPKYQYNIEQLVIADADYIPDNVFEENPYCEA